VRRTGTGWLKREEIALANLLYESFLIIAGADLDKLTGEWVPIATIGWGTAIGTRGLQFLTSLPERFATTAEAAVDAGLTQAKRWVEERIGELGRKCA
jgi:hypothetical protein